MIKNNLLASVLFLLFSINGLAQSPKKEGISMFRDTLDGKIDLSRYIIDAKGFVPIPIIITEPALGSFGGGIAPLFITPKKKPEGYTGYAAPDVTVGFGMYTANKSWAAGAGRIGSFLKPGIKYRVFLAYANINLSFYRDFPNIGEQELEFNIEALPVFLSISKKIGKTEVYAGTQYLHSKNILSPYFKRDLPESITSKELNSTIGTVGLFVDFDKRNTIFTPDKGIRANVLFGMDDSWTGSDYKYQQLSGFINWFVPIMPKWVGGFKFEGQQAFGDVPFYLLPYINMEGIPIARYQGETTLIVATEQRFDLGSSRWSLIALGGLGKAIEKDQSFNDAELIYSYGTGFRYLLARVFGLRAGIDIAKGPDSFGYYIVVGHSWNR